MKFKHSLLPFDWSRCSGKQDVLLCSTCKRNSEGSPWRQSFIEPAVKECSCKNYIPASAEAMLNQWTVDALKETNNE